MKVARTAITLIFDNREEVKTGVWENKLTEKTVKAEQEQIFQRRLDKAMQEGFVINARFRVRSNVVADNLKYVFWKRKKYKVNRVNKDVTNHFAIIELGELI